ncbi:MAG: OB-fold nucleic acid binding domain-containing protein [Candidatus Nitrosocaldus sp.]
MRISDIRSGMSKVSIDAAQVVSISEVREVRLKDGSKAKVADCIIQDDSGRIKLTLWNDQIDMVREGSTISITNGYTKEFKGESTLNIGRYGRLDVVEY